jgi:phage terminase large subunit-like protein
LSSSQDAKLKELQLLKKKLALKEGLPHLYGLPWYDWAWDFFNSTNRYNFLCAANQIGKSSSQIRKCIHWATDPTLWPTLWRRRPLQFWYLYPNQKTATIEVHKKWVEEFLPKGIYKDHPQYGWKLEIKNKEVFALHFNTGVSVYFKAYSQDVHDLQAGSCHAVFCDEELPSSLFPELNMRMAATFGYFHMVFTATRGEEFWRQTIEVKGKGERFPLAFKRQVSMYDCLRYRDGSASHWTKEEVQRLEANCGTKAEVQRRIHGRFIKSEGLKYPSFDRDRNVKPAPGPIPSDWLVYAGIDSGGGGDSHPSAIAFVAVRPDFRKARIFRGWKGDENQDTTASDTLMKYLDLKEKMFVTQARFDWADKDLGVIAGRMGITLQPAEKSHEKGEQMLNVLFKNGILDIDDTEELQPLVQEFLTLDTDTAKQKAKDDYIDSVRYCVATIAWDWSVIQGTPLDAPPVEENRLPVRDTRGNRETDALALAQVDLGIDEELAEWGELY